MPTDEKDDWTSFVVVDVVFIVFVVFVADFVVLSIIVFGELSVNFIKGVFVVVVVVVVAVAVAVAVAVVVVVVVVVFDIVVAAVK